MPEIQVHSLSKAYSGDKVLDDVTFTVHDGEFVTLLGPSGCGKTTTLMSIAGFTQPDEGRIAVGTTPFFDSGAGVNLPAERRNLGIVFQSYAIWPHMTVAENVAFPMKLRKMAKSEIRRRVTEVLDLVEIGSHGGRYAHELSGGQQQRVALARALGYSPSMLLLDEPFSNLDAKLRERAREWLKELQLELGLTTIFVTHDQDEALSMSDRIMVMSRGRILQSGSPEAIYNRPSDRFVADFIGQCNFLEGTVVREAGDTRLRLRNSPESVAAPADVPGGAGVELTLAIRPENVLLDTAAGTGHDALRGTLVRSTFLGDHYRHRVDLAGVSLDVVDRQARDRGPVLVFLPLDAMSVVDASAHTPSREGVVPVAS
jgi:iron(III) transport system ATP-binding protein